MKRRTQKLVLGAALLATMIGVAPVQANHKPGHTDPPPTKDDTVEGEIDRIYAELGLLRAENAELRAVTDCIGIQRRTHGRKPLVVWTCS